MMSQITAKQKMFDLQEAKTLLPLVQALTKRHLAELAPLQSKLNRMLSNDPRREALEQEFEVVVARWKSKIERLGVQASGLWLVDFDVGDGVLSWKYPELGLAYFKRYDAPFSSRVKLTEYIEECDPDWAH